nr:IS66 family insertion sequence element accessory protein TnpB [Jilunia laotingensis]
MKKTFQDVRNEDVYIFINRLKNCIKLLHAETGGLVMYKKLLEEGTFKIPAYDPETHSYPMTWSDLVIMVEDINEDKRKGKQRRLSDLKRHWQISVNKELAGLLFWLFFHYLYTIKQDIE